MVGTRFGAATGVASVLLLFLPYDYFIGSFARFSFLAQVVSETFAVAMWLALVLWDERPSLAAAALFAIAGVGVFLTWPVWIGPPVLVLLVLVVCEAMSRVSTVCAVSRAIGPMARRRAACSRWGEVGRDRAIRARRSAGRVPVHLAIPAVRRCRRIAAVRDRSSRVTMPLAAIAAQTVALLVVWRVSGADSPYMALRCRTRLSWPRSRLAAGALGVLARLRGHSFPARG
jgi:hypothetical protein